MNIRVKASESIKVIDVLRPDAHTAGANSLADVDLSKFTRALFLLNLGVLEATTTITPLIQHADAAGGSYETIWTGDAIAVAADEQIHYLDLNLTNPNIKRYLKITLTGANDAADMSATLLLMGARVEPVSQDDDVDALSGTWATGIAAPS